MSTAKNEQKIADRDKAIRKVLTMVLHECAQRPRDSKKRLQIAEEMSVHAGMSISKAMLDHWTASPTIDSAHSRFPAFLIEPFCLATGDDRLQRAVMGPDLCRKVRRGEIAFEADELVQQQMKRAKR